MPPGVRRTATVRAGEAFLRALDNESPLDDQAIMLEWLHNYTHSQEERSLDRRRNTVTEAAARLQSDVDRQDRDRERRERVQRQALRNDRRAEQAERVRRRERQRQAEQEERDRQQRERDRVRRENGPSLPPSIPPTIPIVVIPALGAGGEGAVGNATTQNNAANDGSPDNAAATQVPGQTDAATQPDNDDSTQDSPSRVEPGHDTNVEIPNPPLRLGAGTDEPPLGDTLAQIVQLPEIRKEVVQSTKTVKLLLELVLSWFKPAPYKALGESMAYIIDHTSTSEIPKDHDHEPAPGYSLSGKSFDGDVPESLQRLRDRWNHTRSTQCLANKFWQSVKFRLSSMGLFLHWEHLQDVYSSQKPEFAADQAYLRRLVNSIPGNTPRSGRRDAARLKIAIAPYLGIGGNDSLAIYYDYILPLWSDGSLSHRCHDFATALAYGDTHIINTCQDSTTGMRGLLGYREQVLVPEMSGALPRTPPPPQEQGAPLTPPLTRERSGFDNSDVVRDDAGPDDGDVPSESSEEDSSSEDDDDEQDFVVRSRPQAKRQRRR
ncbi:MAG: hypothetical protein Q9197_005163 [Variospora fuerteventurae]